MIGVAIAAGAALIGVVGQAFVNAKTSKASSSELNRLRRLQEQIEQPNFDVSEITPEDLEVVYNYEPEAIQIIEEAAPQLIEKSQLAQQGTDAQLSALERFGQLAETGEDAQTLAERGAARREAEEGFSRASEVRDAQSQRRGLGLGSGAQMALSQADQSSLAQQQQVANEQAAADAALRRMQASQMQAGLGGALTNQEINLAGQNANFINSYNARAADRAQGVESQNVGARNQASQQQALLTNQAQQENTRQRNQAAQAQQDRQNELAQRRFQNQAQLFGQQQGLSDRAQGNIDAAGARTAATISAGTQAIGGIAMNDKFMEKIGKKPGVAS